MPKKTRTRVTKTASALELPAVARIAADVFPVVGVGASAGGIEAMTELLLHLGDAPGVAVVFVLHQDRQHPSLLAEVMARATPLPVTVAREGTALEMNRVYVAPPDAEVHLQSGQIHLEPLAKRGATMPIDAFFHSLAEDQGSRAIAVVLSGSASDGALGTKAIKAEGGIAFAQDESARFDGMPRSAVAAGSIDFVFPPKEIAHELMRIARHAYVANSGAASTRFPEKDLARMFALLRTTHDVDFTHYKSTTIERRIRRRLALRRVNTLADYLEMLRKKPEEVEQLYADLLIRVTGFFRDPEVFDTIRNDILPGLMKDRTSETPMRVWVPGSATGEEVYSLAMLLLEVADDSGSVCPIQIFGTDVNESVVERARAGVYPETITSEVSPERLRRFFTRAENGYRVSKAVRDCCVFARQNVTKDPPFSKLDLISCRNVMIYLGPVLQRQVVSMFHYALRPNGYLLLGSSETIGTFADLFVIVDRKYKIYRKRASVARLPVDFERRPPKEERVERVRMDDETNAVSNVLREADRVLLSRYSPPGVLINDALDVVQFRGRTSLFLEPAPGTASFNVLKMAREGLLADLRIAIHGARKREVPVRREGVRVKNNGGTFLVNIEVIPFTSGTSERYHLVLFEEASVPVDEPPAKGRRSVGKSAGKKEGTDSVNVARMKRELEATREYLQSIIEEQEAMNEELRSANEEIQSSNEELQSTNEELETAKEELQSSNEELTTLNEELQNRNQELGILNNDLVNLLASVDVPIIMLDRDLRIRRLNAVAQRAFRLIPSDVGQSIRDIKLPLVIADLDRMIAGVIESLEALEMDVQDRDGRWYSMRIRPYKTLENRIDGAVLVLVDLGMKKR